MTFTVWMLFFLNDERSRCPQKRHHVTQSRLNDGLSPFTAIETVTPRYCVKTHDNLGPTVLIVHVDRFAKFFL